MSERDPFNKSESHGDDDQLMKALEDNAHIAGLLADEQEAHGLTCQRANDAERERDEARALADENAVIGDAYDEARATAERERDLSREAHVRTKHVLSDTAESLAEARAERVATDATMADTVAAFGLAVANVEMLTTERNAAREDLSECEEEVTLRSQQRDAALDRCRRAAQIIIEEIGASGPESVEESAARVVAEVKKVRAALVRLDRLYADEVMPDTDRPGWLRDALHVRTEDEA